ncbi:hypothetical protein KW783_03975 [Candidatus Parcubacteria bacterium]|nr:hypothetical protein [Candidatus Parcubacteria bacterium]
MLKNPYINAVLAALYIVTIVFSIQSVTSVIKDRSDNNLLIPMTMLSLFVLSAALMGLLFVYTPLKLFLENQKNEALVFFLKTVGTFACFAVVFVVLLLLV